MSTRIVNVKIKIVPFANVRGTHRTGGLRDLDKQDIDRILGFEPNVADDTSKVRYSWGFKVGNEQFAIWDYKESYRFGEWSTYGNPDVLEAIFGDVMRGGYYRFERWQPGRCR